MWTYSQSTGKLSTGSPAVAHSCYSGYEAGLNNPAMEGHLGVGPIPRGNWTFGEALQHGPGHTGLYVLPIVPDAPTRERVKALGRDPDSFYLHGDVAANVALHLEIASRGCIVTDYMTRIAVNQSKDKRLTVVA